MTNFIVRNSNLYHNGTISINGLTFYNLYNIVLDKKNTDPDEIYGCRINLRPRALPSVLK